jgi:hypothetical protein
MTGFVYSLLRFAPNPATGEFVNLGAIAGSEASGEWSIRHVQNDQRARSLGADVPVAAFYEFYGRLADEIERHSLPQLYADSEGVEPLDSAWLAGWAARARNIVQLSKPQPLVAKSAEEALDVIFEHMIEDPARSRFRFMTRRAVYGELRRAYWGAGLKSRLRERCVLRSEAFSTRCDFVVGQDTAVQLAQSYSFGIASQLALASEVKAWGWTIAELRRRGGHALTQSGEEIAVAKDVNIRVLYAAPEEERGLASLDEARSVFAELDVEAVQMERADEVADEAASLLSGASLSSA